MEKKLWLKALSDSTFTTNGIRGILSSNHRSFNNQMIDMTWMPAGMPIPWPGPATTVPDGWHLCDGALFSITDYADLFNALGGYQSPYGVQSTTFSLPNIPEGTSIVQMGANQGYALGAKGGAKNHTLTIEEMPNHGHSIPYTTLVTGTGVKAIEDGPLNSNQADIIGKTGGSQPHNNMPPYIAMNWIIKLR